MTGLSLELERIMEDPLTRVERRGERGLHGATIIRAWEQRAHAISRKGSSGGVGLFRLLLSSYPGLPGFYR